MSKIAEEHGFRELLDLTGRTVVVAGAGQGMGRESAFALAENGAHVVCVDLDKGRAESVADEVGGTPVVADMTEESGVLRVLDAAEEAPGTLKGIVDIIGISTFARLADVTEEAWDEQHRLNIRHAFLLLRHAPARMEAGSSMVFIASVSGMRAATSHAPYGAAKAGLISLVASAATELGPVGVRVNAVSPGTILTPRAAERLTAEEQAAWSRQIPLRRMGSVQDIASAVLFLISDLAGYVSGQNLVVDGAAMQKGAFPDMLETP